MLDKLKTYIILLLILFTFAPHLSHAGFLDGLVKDLQKNLPTQGKTNKSPNLGDAPEKPKKKIEAGKIGQMCIGHLKKLDHVAYIRFASVYRDFKNIDSFTKVVELLKK